MKSQRDMFSFFLPFMVTALSFKSLQEVHIIKITNL